MSIIGWLEAKKYFLVMMLTAFFLFPNRPANVGAAEIGVFPDKKIKIIVAQTPGGSFDMEMRGFIPYIKKYLGGDMVIEYMPGAAGKMGLSKCWNAKPDGYTLIYNGTPQSIMTEYLFKTEYKTSEFTHVFGLSSTVMVLCAHPDNWKTMEEFLKVAREKTLTGGLPSPGSASHINGLISVDKLGMKVNWVPYEGAAGVITGVAGKHLDFAILSTTSAYPMVAAGKLRPLMTYSQAQDASFPDVPFPEKLGYKMTMMSTIRGFLAPPKTPAKLVKILNDAMFRASQDPAYAAWAKKVNLEITPLEARKYLAETEGQYAILETYKKLFKRQ